MSARDVLAAYFGRHTTATDTQLIAADAILSALDKAGYAVVPKEPTDELYFAFYGPSSPSGEGVKPLWKRRYKALLTAAKETP